MKKFLIVCSALLSSLSAHAGMSLDSCVGLLGGGYSGVALCSKTVNFSKPLQSGEVYLASVDTGGGASCERAKVATGLAEGEGAYVRFILKDQVITLYGNQGDGRLEITGVGAGSGTYRVLHNENVRDKALASCLGQ